MQTTKTDDKLTAWLLRTAIIMTMSLLVFLVTMIYQLNTEIALMKADLILIHQDHLDFRNRVAIVEQSPPLWLKSQQETWKEDLSSIKSRLSAIEGKL